MRFLYISVIKIVIDSPIISSSSYSSRFDGSCIESIVLLFIIQMSEAGGAFTAYSPCKVACSYVGLTKEDNRVLIPYAGPNSIIFGLTAILSNIIFSI